MRNVVQQNICCSDRSRLNLGAYEGINIIIYAQLIYYCLHLVGPISSINIYSLEVVMAISHYIRLMQFHACMQLLLSSIREQTTMK
jgi:hypothetical protein